MFNFSEKTTIGIQIEHLQELLKTYYILESLNDSKAPLLKKQINNLRVKLAFEAEMRRIFIEQVNIRSNLSAYPDSYFIKRGTNRFTISKIIGTGISTGASVFLEKQGSEEIATNKSLTNQTFNWEVLFSSAGFTPNAPQAPFEFEPELFFDHNESLNITFDKNPNIAALFIHGANLNESEPIGFDAIESEIQKTLPQWEIVPISFVWPSTAGVPIQIDAVDASGNTDILSTRSDRSILLTGLSYNTESTPIGQTQTQPNSLLTLIDITKNQEICTKVQIGGVCGDIQNKTTTYYDLPYPHLLRAKSQLKVRLSALRNNNVDTPTNFNFYGFAI